MKEQYEQLINGFNNGYTFPVKYGDVLARMYKTDEVIWDWKKKTSELLELWPNYKKSLQEIVEESGWEEIYKSGSGPTTIYRWRIKDPNARKLVEFLIKIFVTL